MGYYGGAGGAGGAGGVGVSNAGTIVSFSNNGPISGGAGDAGYLGGAGGAGAAGVSNGGMIVTLNNSGAVSGGAGGAGGGVFTFSGGRPRRCGGCWGVKQWDGYQSQ